MDYSKVVGFTYVFVILALICHSVGAVPKQQEATDNSNTYPNNAWRRRSPAANETEAAASDRTQRLGNLGNLGSFGSTGYGNSLGGYGTGYSVGSYGKPSIDLGGVVLGTLIGIGALLVLPKILNVFSGPGGVSSSGGYYRNNDETGISDMMSRLDDFMAQHNVDSNSCMQKAICHFVRSADYHSSVGTADQIESMISTISENSIIDYMLEGTAIKDAIENGKNPTGRDCDSIYPACPLDRQSALQMMKKFLPLPGRQNQK